MALRESCVVRRQLLLTLVQPAQLLLFEDFGDLALAESLLSSYPSGVVCLLQLLLLLLLRLGRG